MSREGVAKVIKRFNQRGLDVLSIAASRGRKPTYTRKPQARMKPDRIRRSRSPEPAFQPEGSPAVHPHEYERGGTAKLLTLFHLHSAPPQFPYRYAIAK